MRNIIIASLIVAAGCFAASQAQTPVDSTGRKTPTLYVVGVSHLDTQWRWTIQETINEYVPATFRDNFKLMDLYPDYVFSFEGAFKYMLLKEYYPDEYHKLGKYITDGRWRVAGGWVDPVDVNMPSFESLVRHTLYGNGYFKQEFGKTSRDVLLPDCFGFGYALPSIAAHCGLKSFSTQKLSWGSAFGVPFDIGIWEGVDGSSLYAALRPGDYVGKIRQDLSRDTIWMKAIERQGDASGLYAAYRYFGTGDIGGSPDSESVAWLQKSIDADGPITVRSVGSDDLADIVTADPNVRLPRYKGELLMTRHGVGCYTSQAALKRWNRKNELLIDAAERASVMANMLGGLPYPREALKENWIRFLWHQFHDDLTGTSIPEAYEFSWNDEILCLNRSAQILERAVAAATPALDTRVQGIPIVVYNPLSISRQDVVEATVLFEGNAPATVRVYDPDGNEAPSQVIRVSRDSLTVLFLASVPSVGYAVFDVRPAETPFAADTKLRVKNNRLENDRYVVRLSNHGTVLSIFDRSAKRELLRTPISMQLLHDKPRGWPAWEIWYDDIMSYPRPIPEKGAEAKILENGPVRVCLEVTKKTDKSVFRTRISLAAGEAGNRVEFDNEVDWYENEKLLKVAFPLAVSNDSVTYDLGLGTIQRGLSRKELYEVPGQQWADLTSRTGDYGIAILNDCKYGWDHPGSQTLRLTLIHTPGVYDSWSWVGDQKSQDMGHHAFRYAVVAHRGDWRRGDIPWEAARFNQPLSAFQVPSHPGKLGKRFSFLEVVTDDKAAILSPGSELPPVMITAVKQAESGDDIVIRIRETAGRPVEQVLIRFPEAVARAREANGVEETMGDAQISDGALVASLSSYQPKTFVVSLADAKRATADGPRVHPLELPYNLDGISLDEARTDGSFDADGNSLSGELVPDTLTIGRIAFAFGPDTPGAKNVVSCKGQTLTLPAGAFERLHLLAASVAGPAFGTFTITGPKGNQSVPVWTQDYAEPIGQWNNRLVSGAFIEEPEGILPAYINRAPVAWTGTHRHTSEGENEAYRFTYLYHIIIDLPENATAVILPDNERIRLLAATVAATPDDNVRPAQPLYDVAENTIARIQAERTSFIDQLDVHLTTPNPGAVIHYTLDGSDPGVASPIYDPQQPPLALTQTTTVKARAIMEGAGDRHVTTLTFAKLIPRPADQVGDALSGLRCQYYEGEWTRLPKFDSLTAVVDTTRDSISIPEFAREEDYALKFTGYVRVPQDGVYDFYINSDDGSALQVGDSVKADNDGIHGDQEASLEIALKAGYHPITVWMFQAKGGQALEVSIQGPGLEKQPLSPGMLFHTPGKEPR